LELPARQGLSNKPLTLQEAVELFSKKEQLTGGDEAQSYGMLTGDDEAKSLGKVGIFFFNLILCLVYIHSTGNAELLF
jgi:hypothetical protein